MHVSLAICHVISLNTMNVLATKKAMQTDEHTQMPFKIKTFLFSHSILFNKMIPQSHRIQFSFPIQCLSLRFATKKRNNFIIFLLSHLIIKPDQNDKITLRYSVSLFIYIFFLLAFCANLFPCYKVYLCITGVTRAHIHAHN